MGKSETRREAEHRLKRKPGTIKRWHALGLVSPCSGGSGKPYQYRVDEINDAAQEMEERKREHGRRVLKLAPKRSRKRTLAILADGRKSRWGKRPAGSLSARQVAAEFGLSGHKSVYDAYKAGRLKAVGTKPFAFTRKSAEKAFGLPKIPADWVSISELKQKAPLGTELSNVRGIVTAHKIPTRRFMEFDGRGTERPLVCVPRSHEQFIVDRLEIAEQEPGELTIHQAAKEFDRPYRKIETALDTHAPTACRTVLVRFKHGARVSTLAPREAIEAALRGEHWEPPAQAMPAAARTTNPRENAKPAKSKGGRPAKWADLDSFIDRLLNDDPTISNSEILNRYRKARGGVLGSKGYPSPTLRDVRERKAVVVKRRARKTGRGKPSLA